MDTIQLFRSCLPVFVALGDETRQDIVVLLTQKKSLSVNDITAHIDLSRPAVSHHLKLLKEAGLVRVERIGKQRLYSLAFTDKALLLRQLIDTVEEYHRIKH